MEKKLSSGAITAKEFEQMKSVMNAAVSSDV